MAITDVFSDDSFRLLSEKTDPPDYLQEVLSNLTSIQQEALRERAGHVQEVLTGYRSGSEELKEADEPRSGYGPAEPLGARERLKADELGVSLRTVQRWVSGYRRSGPAGIMDRRGSRVASVYGNLDPRWVEEAWQLIREFVDRSTISKGLAVQKIQARVEAKHGKGEVRIPSRATAYRHLTRMDTGHYAFHGSAKTRRSTASRPEGTYGRLRATRVGEYVELDTTVLDVFALDRATSKRTKVELTIAMDVFSRCVLGLRLAPESTNSVDVAEVLFETIVPRKRPDHWDPEARWPYPGMPTGIIAGRKYGIDMAGPNACPETIVVDHGKVYLSEHVLSVCASLGISIQYGRPYRGSDKAVIERWFRTLREGVLETLPGYKGPDIYGRGLHVEQDAFFYIDELEDQLRQWIAGAYHRRTHKGLCLPREPKIEVSPYDMFEFSMLQTGYMQVPPRSDLVYDFLPIEWRRINHYGVELGGLRYNGPALDAYRNSESKYRGSNPGKWPFRVNPADCTYVLFRDEQNGQWHQVPWEHAARLQQPFSGEDLKHVKEVLKDAGGHRDGRALTAEIVARYGVHMTDGPEEHKVSLAEYRNNSRRISEYTHNGPALAPATIRGPDNPSAPIDSQDELDIPQDQTDVEYYGQAFRILP
ncbi:helix-turn-helix domain-containing protein [Arthrobacter sp. CAU 1506]|uniref:helix-turn-helix domain-containing protein n=1 Tax=Arthrobacter sp. CAU 1506 TaxID=2560052 RepID=UPI00145EF055|nr:helix-turn-helix domain-containing protein [Arthrobacter sp. CAU 1506]